MYSVEFLRNRFTSNSFDCCYAMNTVRRRTRDEAKNAAERFSNDLPDFNKTILHNQNATTARDCAANS
jgi:hypothetical protein